MDLDASVPEFWLSEHPESLSLIKALSAPPHVLEYLEASRGRPLPWPMTDVERAEIAAYILRTLRPHVLLVHLFDHDNAQHEHGPGSRQASEALEKIDSQVGMLLGTLDAIGLRQSTTIAIVSDHGFRPTRTELHPNALFKQEGLLTTDASGRITAWDAYYHSAGGSGFVYLKRPDDAALKNRVWQLLDRLRQDPANGIEVLWTREDLARLGAHPGAAFGIGLASGFYSSGATGALLAPAKDKGGHGYDPANPELNASLILGGAGITRRGDLGIVRMTQIAPTLARLLGVGLSPLADEPLWSEPPHRP
jgi:hypothetical protein